MKSLNLHINLLQLGPFGRPGDTRSHITGDFGVFMDGRVFSGYGLVEAATQWEREVRIW
jgi:hypothetical protein